MSFSRRCLAIALVGLLNTAPHAVAAAPEIVSVVKIWDQGPHNAFTDLIRWRGQWYCTFREADAHVGGDGKLRVLASADGTAWGAVGLIAENGIDLRDPKLSVTPDDRLMIVAGGSVYRGGKTLLGRQPRVAFSTDGRQWTPPQRVLAEGDWLWRVTWHEGRAYGVAYNGEARKTKEAQEAAKSSTPVGTDPADWKLKLVVSEDGVKFDVITYLGVPGFANETTLRFLPDGELLALVRREGGNTFGWIGHSKTPYKDWHWYETKHRFGGPNFCRLPDGSLWATSRSYPGGAKTALARMEREAYEPLLTLPSGGDTSYAGMVWHDGLLWVSYYSSHEGKSSIYLAKVRLPQQSAATEPVSERRAAYPAPVVGQHILRDFRFAIGETLPEVRLHYRTIGQPRRDAQGRTTNAVLILHGTTGDGENFLRPEFAGELFGPGQPLDASQYYLIIPDNLGHGRSSKPSDGLRARFPRYGYGDMVKAQHQLLTEALQVTHLRLVMGTSMGGMHTWLWGQEYPDFMDALLPLASLPTEIAGRNRIWRKLVSDAIRSDPEWLEGEYKTQPRNLRLVGEMFMFMSGNPVVRQKEAPTRAETDRRLEEYVTRFVRSKDANDVLYAVESSRDYDPGPGLDKIRALLLAINFADDLINPPELGILEQGIQRVKHGKALVIPQGDRTQGHGTHTLAAVWKAHLEELLNRSRRSAEATPPPGQATDKEKLVALRGDVVDAESGRSLPARVYIQGQDGSWHFPRSAAAQGSAVPYRKQRTDQAASVEMHTTLSAHPFVAELPPGVYTITVEHGKEYRPLVRTVTLGTEAVAERLPLQRWVDMAARGWFSGDTHVHRTLDELPNVMLAEDLNVAFPLTYWVTEAFASPKTASRNPLGKVDPRLIAVDDTHVIYPLNTEYELFTVNKQRHTLGAFFALNHQSVLDQGVPPVRSIAELVHRERGLIELDKHNWPWTMALVPVLKPDLYELANNHVWRTEFGFPSFGEPAPEYMKIERTKGGFTERGWIDYGFQNYYALLNCGIRLRPTAGTASGVHPVPLGFGRVYVHCPKGLSYEAWLQGLRDGRSFVTTGPMLFVQVNDEEAGHTFKVTAGKPSDFRVSGSVLSEHPLDRLEIIVNGEVARTLTPSSRKNERGAHETTFDESLRVDGSSWIAVRCFENRPDRRVRFAHSSPVHVDVADKPLRPRRAEVEFLIKRVEEQISRSAEVLPAAALAEYQESLQFYQRLARDAR